MSSKRKRDEDDEGLKKSPTSNNSAPTASSSTAANAKADVDLASMQREFDDYKDKYYKQKLAELKLDIEKIKDGSHPDYVEECQELEAAFEQQMKSAEDWKEYQIQNIKNVFQGEREASLNELNEEKRQLRDRLVNAVLERKKAISEERNSMTLGGNTEDQQEQQQQSRVLTRTLRRRGGLGASADLLAEQGREQAKPQPPYINYTLSNHEVSEDLDTITRLLGRRPAAVIIAARKPRIQQQSVVEYIDRHSFRIDSSVLKKGFPVIVRNQSGDLGWTGVITHVSQAEFQIRCDDGAKARFPFQQVRMGSYVVGVVS